MALTSLRLFLFSALKFTFYSDLSRSFCVHSNRAPTPSLGILQHNNYTIYMFKMSISSQIFTTIIKIIQMSFIDQNSSNTGLLLSNVNNIWLQSTSATYLKTTSCIKSSVFVYRPVKKLHGAPLRRGETCR